MTRKKKPERTDSLGRKIGKRAQTSAENLPASAHTRAHGLRTGGQHKLSKKKFVAFGKLGGKPSQFGKCTQGREARNFNHQFYPNPDVCRFCGQRRSELAE